MPDDAYGSLADHYDLLQSGTDVRTISGRVDALIKRFGPKTGDGELGKLILCDLGCGTGSITFELARNGYEVIGVDRSQEMLSVARETFSEGGREALFICQNISRLDLYGTADVFVSLTDTLNHLTNRRDFDRLFSRLKYFLNPGGLFIFDLLTLHYMREVRGNSRFQDITEDYALFWQNRFSDRGGLSRADMTLFSKSDGNLFERTDFSVSERYYSESDVRSASECGGLELLAIFGDYKNVRPGQNDIRHLYVARRRPDAEMKGTN